MTGTDRSGNWIIVDGDGSWHSLDTAWAVALTDEQIESVHTDHAADIGEFLSERDGEYPEGTLVVWEDVRQAIAVALSSEHIPAATIASVLATADDAIANNTYG